MLKLYKLRTHCTLAAVGLSQQWIEHKLKKNSDIETKERCTCRQLAFTFNHCCQRVPQRCSFISRLGEKESDNNITHNTPRKYWLSGATQITTRGDQYNKHYIATYNKLYLLLWRLRLGRNIHSLHLENFLITQAWALSTYSYVGLHFNCDWYQHFREIRLTLTPPTTLPSPPRDVSHSSPTCYSSLPSHTTE